MNKAIPLLIVFVTVTVLVASAATQYTETVTYTLHGPYYGKAGNAVVEAAVLWVNGTTLNVQSIGDFSIIYEDGAVT